MPWTSPSSMNGTRMNQLVAPTSFITSISRRRANMAMRIVLRINRPAAPRRKAAMTKMPTVRRLDSCWMSLMVSEANTTLSTPDLSENCDPSASTARTSLSTGSTRNDGGQVLGLDAGDHLRGVGEQDLELLVRRRPCRRTRCWPRRGCPRGHDARRRSGPGWRRGAGRRRTRCRPASAAWRSRPRCAASATHPTRASETATVSTEARVMVKLRPRLDAGLPDDVVELHGMDPVLYS